MSVNKNAVMSDAKRRSHASEGDFVALENTRPLTEKQKLYLKYYFECDGKSACIDKKAGFNSLGNTINLGKTTRMQMEVARELRNRQMLISSNKKFEVSKDDRIELLWGIAQSGTERISDKEGNMIMANPGVSVSAIRTINEMIPGSIAPKEVEITHKEDTRSEAEIRANIARLQEEYSRLLTIDGDAEIVSEDKVRATRELPKLNEMGQDSGETYVPGEDEE